MSNNFGPPATDGGRFEPELLSTRQAAELAGVGERTWWAHSRTGFAPAPIFFAGRVCYRRTDVMEWIGDGCPQDPKRRALARVAEDWIVRTLLAVGQATSENLIERADMPAGVDAMLLGAVPASLVRLGLIRAAAPSRRRKQASGRTTTWRLVDPAKAAEWLKSRTEAAETSTPCSACP
jgi:hypothetical protein